MTDKEIYRELMDLMGFMITSARGLLDEPPLYGPFRLIDGASRICSILEGKVESDSDFLMRLRSKIDEGKFSVMTDVDTFKLMLDEIVIDFTKKLKEL